MPELITVENSERQSQKACPSASLEEAATFRSLHCTSSVLGCPFLQSPAFLRHHPAPLCAKAPVLIQTHVWVVMLSPPFSKLLALPVGDETAMQKRLVQHLQQPRNPQCTIPMRRENRKEEASQLAVSWRCSSFSPNLFPPSFFFSQGSMAQPLYSPSASLDFLLKVRETICENETSVLPLSTVLPGHESVHVCFQFLELCWVPLCLVRRQSSGRLDLRNLQWGKPKKHCPACSWRWRHDCSGDGANLRCQAKLGLLKRTQSEHALSMLPGQGARPAHRGPGGPGGPVGCPILLHCGLTS